MNGDTVRVECTKKSTQGRNKSQQLNELSEDVLIARRVTSVEDKIHQIYHNEQANITDSNTAKLGHCKPITDTESFITAPKEKTRLKFEHSTINLVANVKLCLQLIRSLSEYFAPALLK